MWDGCFNLVWYLIGRRFLYEFVYKLKMVRCDFGGDWFEMIFGDLGGGMCWKIEIVDEIWRILNWKL